MIKVDYATIEANQFPDHTLLVKAPTLRGHGEWVHITWHYENDAELFALICLRKHYNRAKAILYMPYCPHARMDRVKESNDIFTLKYFAEIINDLNFERVDILDPHSSVCTALINNVRVLDPKQHITSSLYGALGRCYFNWNTVGDELLMFYPDEGSMKRYSGMISLPYAFGIKKRDWKTGAIEGLDVAGEINQIAGKKILIVDDICSRGGTFYHSAKKLKELGAKEIYLYITHCENTILEGELLTSGLIEKVYTTNSIFTKEHEKIEVFEI